jgi:hypothetical protein
MAEHYTRSIEFEDSVRLYRAVLWRQVLRGGLGSSSGDCKALLRVQWSTFLGLPLRLSGGSMADVRFGWLDDVRILRFGSQ